MTSLTVAKPIIAMSTSVDCSSSLPTTRLKRKPGYDAELPRGVAQHEEVRLPASTMLYRRRPCQPQGATLSENGDVNNEPCSSPENFGLNSDHASEFSLHPCYVLDQTELVLQVRPKAALRLLRVIAQNSDLSDEHRRDLISEAEARSLDGLLVLESSIVILLRPAEQVTVVDDDKKEGINQQLLTDMFIRMSLK